LDLIEKIKVALKPNGYVIVSCFTTASSDGEKALARGRCYFAPEELRQIFSDFKIIFYQEKKFEDKGHPGMPEPHWHATVKMIAYKYNS
jgi:hypothetical protein